MYEKFLKLLKEQNLTVRDVCNQTGIPESTMSMWKRRYEEWGGSSELKEPKPSVDTLEALAKFFKVPIGYFFNNED